MQNIRSEFPEIDEIRKDLESLKSNVVELSTHVKAESKDQASRLGDAALDSIAKLRKSAEKEYHKAEDNVKAQPGRSVAIAFAAGIVLSMFLGRGK